MGLIEASLYMFNEFEKSFTFEEQLLSRTGFIHRRQGSTHLISIRVTIIQLLMA